MSKSVHSAKKPDFGGHFLEPAHAMPKPGACGPRRLGPGGRRGFYARALCLSTIFSRKKRISQHFEKLLKKQRDFCAPSDDAVRVGRLGIATVLTYRFA